MVGVVGAVGLAVVLAVFGVVPGRSLFARSREEVLTYRVKRGQLAVSVKEKGSLESAKNEDVINEVEGQTVIISILPEGSHVTKGQLVCELDSSNLKDTLNNQKITTERAQADYDNATKTHEVALIAIQEYKRGIFPDDLETAEGDITLAESNLSRARDRLEWSDRMAIKKYIATAQNLADKSSLLNAEISLKNARRKKLTLVEYTKEKQVASLQADVAKALSDKKAREAALNLERQKEAKLVRQIEKCKLVAPNDGLVVYGNDANRMPGNNQPQIEEGATVRERQKIFSLPDVAHMRVNTKVHESKIDKVAPGLRAKVRVDAFPNETLRGRVEEVKPLPDPASFFSSDIKQYTTFVAIEKGPAGLRPGMNAQVEVLVKQLDDIVSVPIQAVLQYQGKDYIYIVGPDSRSERRQVTLGISNDKQIEVREGIKEGEEVALNPTALMSREERETFGGAASAKDAGKAKAWSGVGGGGTVGGGPAGPGGEASPSPAMGGPEDAGKARGKGARTGRGRAGMPNLPPEILEKLKAASPEERRQMIEEFKSANPGMFPAGGSGGPPGGGGGFGGPPGAGGPGQ